METVLFGCFLTQENTIKDTFREMKPFLNINGETGSYCYRLIATLKVLFVGYAFNRAFQKPLSVIVKRARNLCIACHNPIWKEVLPKILSVFIIFLLCKVPLAFIYYGEFFVDIFLLLFLLNYAVEAYKKELQKISSLTFLCLFVLWRINNTATPEQFGLSPYFQVSALLFLSWLPMMPSNPMYRHRVNYLYVLMYIWVFYKFDQQYDKHQYATHQNKMKAIIEEQQAKPELERSKLDGISQNLGINRESIAQSEATHFEEISKREMEMTNEASRKEKDLIKASPERVTEDNEVAASEYVSTADSSITSRKHETRGSNDVNHKHGGKVLNKKKLFQVSNKRQGEMGQTSANTEKANELGSKVKTNHSTMQISPNLKSKFRVMTGNGIQGTAGKNLISNVQKRKVSQINFRTKVGTKLQIKHEESKGRALITNQFEKQGKLKPERVQIIKSKKDKHGLLLISE